MHFAGRETQVQENKNKITNLQTRIGGWFDEKMGYRKDSLSESQIYHICTKSIAEYTIFRSGYDYNRLIETLQFYNYEKRPCKYSAFLELFDKSKREKLNEISSSKKLVKILSFCIMPTHIHLLLQQLTEKGISKYMNLVLKSYSRYFNVKYNRLGPLFQSRFRNILVENNEQLLHVMRYIHLNPVSAYLVDKPEEWKYSSFCEHNEFDGEKQICDFKDFIDISAEDYKRFVWDNIDYQRELQKIKQLTLE